MFKAGDFDPADVKALRDLLANGGTCGIEVGWSDVRELALPEPGDELVDKLLIFCVALVVILGLRLVRVELRGGVARFC